MKESITLKYPVTFDGDEISSLTLRRPKVQDRLTAQRSGGSELEQELRLMAKLCDISPDMVLELDLADYSSLKGKLTGVN